MTLPEYEYVALQEIWEGRVRAYNVGDPVPRANVEARGYVVGEQVELRENVSTAQALEQAPRPVPPPDPGSAREDTKPDEAAKPGAKTTRAKS
jgi:hypothetical protein